MATMNRNIFFRSIFPCFSGAAGNKRSNVFMFINLPFLGRKRGGGGRKKDKRYCPKLSLDL